jgi:putative phage-type endonuclease
VIERHVITDRASWLARRAQDLTASDIAAAVGVSPFKTSLALYAEKTGHLMPDPETPIMRRGRHMERTAISMLREEHPDWDIKYPLDLYWRDPELRLGATPDAEAIIPGHGRTNIQIKVVGQKKFDSGWVAGPPLAYQLQTLCEGMLMEADHSLLVALVDGYSSLTLETFDVARNAEAEARIREHAMSFWDNIRTGKRPQADLARDAETLAILYPQSVPEPVLDLSHDNELPELLIELADLKAEIASREHRKRLVETGIKDKMGFAEVAVCPGWRITWKTTTIHEHVRPEVSFRRLSVAEVKPEEKQQPAAIRLAASAIAASFALHPDWLPALGGLFA